jgi:hypothetical protein
MTLRSLPVLAVFLSSLPAWATDAFEIQVYQGEHNEPWQASCELHTNYTVVGHTTPAYEGQTPPNGALRMTLEPALGLTDWLEIGAYLQAMVTPYAGAEFAGWKLRAKFVVPERVKLPLTLGINVELGRVPLNVEEAGWANEFRPILSWEHGQFGLTFNPIFGFALTGPDAFKPDFEPALKTKWNTNRGFALGLEYYAGLGRFDGFDPLRDQTHLVFAVFDLEPPVGDGPPTTSPWELNVAVGTGLTRGTPQQLIVKTIVGRSF